jgi:GNAT superfamily N-acetyltransferase
MQPKLTFKPLTHEIWNDFAELFGSNGACGGCWCMWWRLKRSRYERQKGVGNKRAMRKIVRDGSVPGIIAYLDDQPFAWCSIGPRENYPVLERSRVLGRIDDTSVWSIVCFFVKRPYRRSGYLEKLIQASLQYAKKRGARIVEAYPVAASKQTADVFVYTGLFSTFKKTGFVEVARRSRTRPIMRYEL